MDGKQPDQQQPRPEGRYGGAQEEQAPQQTIHRPALMADTDQGHGQAACQHDGRGRPRQHQGGRQGLGQLSGHGPPVHIARAQIAPEHIREPAQVALREGPVQPQLRAHLGQQFRRGGDVVDPDGHFRRIPGAELDEDERQERYPQQERHEPQQTTQQAMLHVHPSSPLPLPSRNACRTAESGTHQKYIFSKGISYCDTPNDTPLSSRTWTALVRE